MIELGVGVLTIGALGYAIHWRRERMKWGRIRKKQMKRLRWVKKKLEREKQMLRVA